MKPATILAILLAASSVMFSADRKVVIESDARESDGLFHQITLTVPVLSEGSTLQYQWDTNLNLQLPYMRVTNSWSWSYVTNVEPWSLTITNPSSVSVVWEPFNLQVNVQTNIVTEWKTVREENCIIPAALSIHCTDDLYQVGFLITNRVLRVITEGKTNEVILKQLGRDIWPSQQRIEQIPARYRP
jgi:hypothetical protein